MPVVRARQRPSGLAKQFPRIRRTTMARSLMEKGKQANPAERQHRSISFHPIRGACTICTEISFNGAKTGIKKLRKMTQSIRSVRARGSIVCCAAVRGAVLPKRFDQRSVFISDLVTVTPRAVYVSVFLPKIMTDGGERKALPAEFEHGKRHREQEDDCREDGVSNGRCLVIHDSFIRDQYRMRSALAIHAWSATRASSRSA